MPRSVGSRCQGRSDTRVTSGPQTYTLPCTLCTKHFLGCAIPCDGMQVFVTVLFQCSSWHMRCATCAQLSTCWLCHAVVHKWRGRIYGLLASQCRAVKLWRLERVLYAIYSPRFHMCRFRFLDHRDATVCLLFGFPHPWMPPHCPWQNYRFCSTENAESRVFTKENPL